MSGISDWKKNIYFVLVEPIESGNIGACARAIKNMGFENLVLVGAPPVLKDEATWFAHQALDVLGSAQRFDTVAEAIRDCPIVVGTTRRQGKLRQVIYNLRSGAMKLHTFALANKIAILFGREDKGLSNEEIEQCGFLITIPTSKLQPSLNLAQAVALTAYEMKMSGTKSMGKAGPPLVPHEDLEGLFGHIEATLAVLGFPDKGDRNLSDKMMRNFKSIFGRTGLTIWERGMLHGVCTKIEELAMKAKKTPE